MVYLKNECHPCRRCAVWKALILFRNGSYMLDGRLSNMAKLHPPPSHTPLVFCGRTFSLCTTGSHIWHILGPTFVKIEVQKWYLTLWRNHKKKTNPAASRWATTNVPANLFISLPPLCIKAPGNPVKTPPGLWEEGRPVCCCENVLPQLKCLSLLALCDAIKLQSTFFFLLLFHCRLNLWGQKDPSEEEEEEEDCLLND